MSEQFWGSSTAS